MSSNLQSLQSLNTAARHRTDAQGALGGANPADLLAGAAGGAERASFSKWMSQLQDARATMAQQPALAGAKPPVAVPTAARQPAAQPASPQQAGRKPGADKTEHAAAERQKAAQKSAQSKPQGPQARPASQADASRGRGEVDGGAEDVHDDAVAEESTEVQFATAQGESTAWVQELQPPADLPTADPSAMLAWLSSLTQAEGGAAALPQEAAQGAEGQGASAGRDGLHGLAAELRGLPPTATAALEGGAQGAAASEANEGVAALAAGDGKAAEALDFSALMAREVGRTATASARGTEATHHTGTLSTPVDSPDFQDALAERVGLWVSGAAQSGPMTAELRLNPADMGPIHIRIVLEGQSAQVDFAAANADTRQAIEASLPALSGKLEEAGLSLSGGGVSDQSGRQAWAGAAGDGAQSGGGGWRQAQGDDARGTASGERDASALAQPARPLPAARRPGGLDLYA